MDTTSVAEPVDTEKLSKDLAALARARGCRTIIVGLTGEDGSWYISMQGGFEALGMAHKAVQTMEQLIEDSRRK